MGRTEYKQIYLRIICISEFQLKLVERYWGNWGQIKRNNFKQMWARAQITRWKNMSVKHCSGYESLGMSSWYPFYIMVEHYIISLCVYIASSAVFRKFENFEIDIALAEYTTNSTFLSTSSHILKSSKQNNIMHIDTQTLLPVKIDLPLLP